VLSSLAVNDFTRLLQHHHNTITTITIITTPSQPFHLMTIQGGAGFVGSNLVDRLMLSGNHVIVLDNMFTGRQKNIRSEIFEITCVKVRGGMSARLVGG
jgi:hypothetical protein